VLQGKTGKHKGEGRKAPAGAGVGAPGASKPARAGKPAAVAAAPPKPVLRATADDAAPDIAVVVAKMERKALADACSDKGAA
jgi:hypothetical protein